MMFRKKQSLNLRLWHWANALVITGLILTAFMRKTFLNVRTNKGLILEKSHEIGLVISDEQATKIARLIRNQLWQWHPIIGFVAIGLLVYRLFIFVKEKNHKKENPVSPHLRYVKKLYLLFYIVITIMGVTGVLLYWDEVFSLGESLTHNIEEIHNALMWFFIAFIAIHLAGVIKADRGSDAGLISDMFNGGSDSEKKSVGEK